MCVGDYGLLPCRSNRQRYRRREVECIEREVSKETLGGKNETIERVSRSVKERKKAFGE